MEPGTLKAPINIGDGYLYYNLEINPEPWAIGPVTAARNRSNGGMYGKVGRNQQLHAYKMAVAEQLGEYKTFMMPGPYVARYYFWRRRDNYTTPNQREHRKHEADLTNLTKSTEDACQGILFGNDRDCIGIENYMFEQGADVTPRVVVGVSPMGAAQSPLEVLSAELSLQLEL